jgi:hypothetical protein
MGYVFKAAEKMGDGRKEVKESNERGWTDQSNSGDTSRNPLNINLEINNKRQDYKIGPLWGYSGGEGEQRLKWENMEDGLPILTGNRTMKPLAIALSEAGGSWGWEIVGGELTNVQCKPIQNCHNESPCTTNIC